MTTFDEREAAFENKFAHDAATRFKLAARADKKLALWAGALLGKSAKEMEAYVSEVIRADLTEAGHEDVIAKVAADLGSKSSPSVVREKFDSFLAEVEQAHFED